MLVTLVPPVPGRSPGWNENRAQAVLALIDEHCDEAGGVIPEDPDQLRAWLAALVARAYQAGRAGAQREASRR